MDKQFRVILWEIYDMLITMEKSQAGEDYPSYDLTPVIDKVKNHLAYFIEE